MASPRWSNARLLATLLGGLVLLAVVVQGLEMLVGVDPAPPSAAPTPTSKSDGSGEMVRAELRREGEKRVIIEIFGHDQTKITVNDAVEADVLYACIEQALAEAFPDSGANVGQPDGWLVGHAERRRLRDQVNVISRDCLVELNREHRGND